MFAGAMRWWKFQPTLWQTNSFSFHSLVEWLALRNFKMCWGAKNLVFQFGLATDKVVHVVLPNMYFLGLSFLLHKRKDIN